MKLERLTGRELLAYADDLVEVYRAAFAEPPWNEDGWGADAFARRLAADVLRPGFVAVLARDEDGVAGFGTAWRTGSPFPEGRAYGRVRDALGDQVETWLVGALEVDELAVSPRARRQGLGERILALLCEGADACWLLTSPQADGAVRLYERLGWHRLTGPDAGVAVFTTGPA